MLGIVAPVVAGPRSAMHVQHHRQRLVGLSIAIGIGPFGQRKIADQVEAIASLDDLRMHLHQRQLF